MLVWLGHELSSRKHETDEMKRNMIKFSTDKTIPRFSEELYIRNYIFQGPNHIRLFTFSSALTELIQPSHAEQFC